MTSSTRGKPLETRNETHVTRIQDRGAGCADELLQVRRLTADGDTATCRAALLFDGMESIECAVIGAGVIGLGIAQALARAGRDTLILEAAAAIGTGISARNSEVIHAGVYYEPGSLKALLCVKGRDMLYRLCAERRIRHRRCGKLIVASDPDQMAALQAIAERARASGVLDLQLLSRTEALSLEPELDCVGALLSPSTGIIDAHDYMTALLGMAEQNGATLALRSPVDRLRAVADGIELHVADPEVPPLHAQWVINAAGLAAVPLARRTVGLSGASIPALNYAKGSYFTCAQRAPFTHLIYPVPEPAGLGVHLTLDQAGQARFGPDVEWVGKPDYQVDERRAERFYAAIRRYWPALKDGVLSPAYAGIRPKLVGPGEAAADFRIDGPAVHGVDGLVNLFGIESPGLTASLAIADHVVGVVRGVDSVSTR